MLNDGKENVIINVDGEDVTIPSDYLTYTYRIEQNEAITTVGFMDIYRYHRWALKMLGISNVIEWGSVKIEVLPPNYDAWAYNSKILE